MRMPSKLSRHDYLDLETYGGVSREVPGVTTVTATAKSKVESGKVHPHHLGAAACQ